VKKVTTEVVNPSMAKARRHAALLKRCFTLPSHPHFDFIDIHQVELPRHYGIDAEWTLVSSWTQSKKGQWHLS
jgi:hypothetical protein